MESDSSDIFQSVVSRRELLWKAGGGLGGVALSAMLCGKVDATTKSPSTGRHHAPRAKRVIQIFCPGGLRRQTTVLCLQAGILHAQPMEISSARGVGFVDVRPDAKLGDLYRRDGLYLLDAE